MPMLVLVNVCVCLKAQRKSSVSQIHAGAKQSHQLLLVVSDVPLHDLFTGAQQTLKRLDVYYCKDTHTRDYKCFQTVKHMLDSHTD